MQGGRLQALLMQLCLGNKNSGCTHSFDVAYWPHFDIRAAAKLCLKLRDERTLDEHRNSVAIDPGCVKTRRFI